VNYKTANVTVALNGAEYAFLLAFQRLHSFQFESGYQVKDARIEIVFDGCRQTSLFLKGEEVKGLLSMIAGGD
jgi:hypothetical protein